MQRLNNIGKSARNMAKTDYQNTDYKMNINVNKDLFNPNNNQNKIKSVNTRNIVNPKSTSHQTDRNLFDPDKKYINTDPKNNPLSEKPDTHKDFFIKNMDKRTGSHNYYSKENEYIPEITEKRKFSNIIYNQLIKKFTKIDSNSFTQYDVDRLFIKYNLSENENEWDNEQKNNFISGVRNILTSKKNQIVDKNLFEKDTKKVTYLVSIDSNDRDKSKWPNINNYRIDFAPISDVFSVDKPKHGYVNRSFNNVISIELCNVIMPRRAIDGNDLDDYPYIILIIDEFEGVYQGTNDIMNKAFAKITFDKNIGKYKEFKGEGNEHFIKTFNPRIGINKLTIRFLTPDGIPYNFGTDIREPKEILPVNCDNKNDDNISNNDHNKFNPDDNTIENKMKLFNDEKCDLKDEFTLDKNQIHLIDKKDKINPENSLLFKITCYQRALETMYLNRRDS